jgi:hypothetical protein
MENSLWTFGQILCATVCLVAFTGCCSTIVSEPPRPAEVRGWGKYSENGLTMLGEFVLANGQTTSRDNLGVEVTSIVPGRKCIGTESMGPKARVRFFRVSDGTTLLEIDRPVGTITVSDFSPVLTRDFGVSALSINAVNTKDGWVWLELG